VTREPNGRGHLDDAREPLKVVRVEDAVEPKLAARTDAVYESPPQPRQQAMVLVTLLLGHIGEARNGDGRWVTPTAGGRRVVTITEVTGR
jgi:hypothetical protein